MPSASVTEPVSRIHPAKNRAIQREIRLPGSYALAQHFQHG
jgi:hypothetical protein